MLVEACCQSLLANILPFVDSQRAGICLDVGVGTFAFYCEVFANLGFATVAVEPIPVKKLKSLTQKYPIQLIESCLSDTNGTQSLYIGSFLGLFNSNFSSLSPNWFGASTKSKQVPTVTLSQLLLQINAPQVTCLKLDIEGWEYNVIKQLPELANSLMPKVVMFEYGGGVNRAQANKGWSEEFLGKTINCLKILQQCGYSFSIMIDYAPDAQEKIFDLQTIDLATDSLFSSNAVYGNIICCLNASYDQDQIHVICQSYYDVGLINRFINFLVSQ